MGESIPNNEFDIRSSGDVVSGLESPASFVNRMFGKKTNDLVIPAKTNNPLEEHKDLRPTRTRPNDWTWNETFETQRRQRVV